MGEAALTYLACDRPDEARRILDWLEDLARPLECRWPRIAAATVRAAMAERQGERDQAEHQFELALGQHGNLPMPLSEARTRLSYGALLRRRGEPRRARPQFARALELAEACGSAWLVAEAGRELEASGGRRLRNKHPDELTPQESRVAELAARGLSNEGIARATVVSIKTVETHLHHVYEKLGISSRRELIRRASEMLPRAAAPN